MAAGTSSGATAQELDADAAIFQHCQKDYVQKLIVLFERLERNRDTVANAIAAKYETGMAEVENWLRWIVTEFGKLEKFPNKETEPEKHSTWYAFHRLVGLMAFPENLLIFMMDNGDAKKEAMEFMDKLVGPERLGGVVNASDSCVSQELLDEQSDEALAFIIPKLSDSELARVEAIICARAPNMSGRLESSDQ